jgi:hypothetical protein
MNKLKAFLFIIILIIGVSFLLTQCSKKEIVGSGSKENIVVSEKKLWYLFEEIPLNSINTKQMADTIKNYDIIYKYTYWDAVLTLCLVDVLHCQTVQIVK